MLRPVSAGGTTERGWRPDDTTFGARLALVRQHMGWGNVKEAALACGLPVASWRNWERDGRQPRDYVAVCMKISERTGADLAWLAGMPTGVAAHNELGHVGGLTRGNVAAESKCTQAFAEGTPLGRAAHAWGEARLHTGDSHPSTEIGAALWAVAQ